MDPSIKIKRRKKEHVSEIRTFFPILTLNAALYLVTKARNNVYGLTLCRRAAMRYDGFV